MPRTKKTKDTKTPTDTKDAGPSAVRNRQRKSTSKTDGYALDTTRQLQTQPTGRVEAVQSPQIPGNVIKKLVAFSVTLLIAPILTYFLSLNFVFAGSTTPAAITAAVTANIVLAAYVYAAWVEESDGNSSHLKRKSD
ncbi:vacuolar ATPase assembly integral membrane protein vma21 [Coemansia sp. RSA 788]|nr:vacuolar ATPase assembly integral membrane protein vma21 [Coemansia sp. RSA 788]KAJ2175060.1 vacuolar ATPase assembly integral membrane protein vma21 [Coemansia sp. RSA 551]KAJ2187494.1 vacuolar ATPase assembly integral membrane protein vma21 [Coemansia sp. RSA 530]